LGYRDAMGNRDRRVEKTVVEEPGERDFDSCADDEEGQIGSAS
jgi:hypothetical protein